MSNYEHIKDKWVKKALIDYREPINTQKKHLLALSDYTVEKPWGFEKWLELNEFYAFKIIHMKKGNRCSLQSHEKKVEANYVVEGTAKVLLENDEGEFEEFDFGPGTGWVVPVGRKHRVIAVTDYTAVEVSTPHLDDVQRFEDDTNRSHGKIHSEHND